MTTVQAAQAEGENMNTHETEELALLRKVAECASDYKRARLDRSFARVCKPAECRKRLDDAVRELENFTDLNALDI